MTENDIEARLQFFQALLQEGKLRRLPAREVLLHASRFGSIEAAYKERFGGKLIPLRVAMLATLSAQHLGSLLRLYLYLNGIAPAIYVGPFDGIRSEGLDPASGVYGFKPDLLVILPALDEIKDYPALFSSEHAIQSWVDNQLGVLRRVWENCRHASPKCQIVQGLLATPIHRQLGNLEVAYPFSRTNCIRRLNDAVVAARPVGVAPLDIEYLAAVAGKNLWFDEVAYLLSKQPFRLTHAPSVAASIAGIAAAAVGKIRKCLVLDLDNTLWGGVVGDDGVDGIRIDPADAAGEAYLEFQRYLISLRNRGVLLAVCSKNDEITAQTPFRERPEMLLKLDDFAAFVANWDDKITNIRRIAHELNIGIDSLVFFDDNPAERALVEQFEPDVLVVDVPEDPALFVRALDNASCFEWLQLSPEDVSRTATYVSNRKRQQLQDQFSNYDEYLRSLDMFAKFEPAHGKGLPRAVQLINKTNQFNLRTQRYSEQALDTLIADPGCAVVQVRFRDRFADYGIMACVILRFSTDTAVIDTWVMSCRVFNRGLEYLTARVMADLARSRGCAWLLGEYIPTSKNGHVSSLYDDLGFEPATVSPEGSMPPQGRLYRLAVDRVPDRPCFITRE